MAGSAVAAREQHSPNHNFPLSLPPPSLSSASSPHEPWQPFFFSLNFIVPVLRRPTFIVLKGYTSTRELLLAIKQFNFRGTTSSSCETPKRSRRRAFAGAARASWNSACTFLFFFLHSRQGGTVGEEGAIVGDSPAGGGLATVAATEASEQIARDSRPFFVPRTPAAAAARKGLPAYVRAGRPAARHTRTHGRVLHTSLASSCRAWRRWRAPLNVGGGKRGVDSQRVPLHVELFSPVFFSPFV